MIQFPNIDPVIFHIAGPISVKWYSLAYIVGLILGYLYFKWIDKKFKIFAFKESQIDSLLTHIVFGIIIGGRLGYVVLYDPGMFIHDTFNVINTLQGGMSFHGGLIGFCIATYIFCRNNQVNFLTILDISSCLACIPIFFARLANFINAELYGRITDAPWGVVFPTGGPIARHPSQIYEAIAEGLILFVLQNYWLFKKKFIKPGFMAASFAIFYGTSRFFIEFFREADVHIGYFFNLFSIGQFYCLLLIAVGLYLLNKSNRAKV